MNKIKLQEESFAVASLQHESNTLHLVVFALRGNKETQTLYRVQLVCSQFVTLDIYGQSPLMHRSP
jgi:hypothetical protein